MKKVILLSIICASLFAWDCTIKPETVKLVQKNTDVYCRDVTILSAAYYLDNARINTGVGYSQVNEKVRVEMADILMSESQQCYSTCVVSMRKGI